MRCSHGVSIMAGVRATQTIFSDVFIWQGWPALLEFLPEGGSARPPVPHKGFRHPSRHLLPQMRLAVQGLHTASEVCDIVAAAMRKAVDDGVPGCWQADAVQPEGFRVSVNEEGGRRGQGRWMESAFSPSGLRAESFLHVVGQRDAPTHVIITESLSLCHLPFQK